MYINSNAYSFCRMFHLKNRVINIWVAIYLLLNDVYKSFQTAYKHMKLMKWLSHLLIFHDNFFFLDRCQYYDPEKDEMSIR